MARLREREIACRDCFVYRLCKGGCAFTASRFADYNCRARYFENLVALGLALTHLTGGEWLLDDAAWQ